MATRHFYNKTTFEIRGYEDDVNISDYINPLEWTEYTVSQEPAVLINAIQADKSPAELLTEKWGAVNTARSTLTVETTAGNVFAANPEAILSIYRKEASMLSTDSCTWYEDDGVSFTVTKVELQEALNLANMADQDILDTLLA